jgi:hypothetical protein
MSDISSSKTLAAGTVDREIPLREAIGVFCDPELERRWHRAKAQPVYYIGPQRVWATGEIHQVKRRDPAAEAVQASAWSAREADFRNRLRDGELEATGIPYPAADGRRTQIPGELWSVLRVDWRRAMVWDGLAQKPAPGDQVWRDVRVRPHEPRTMPHDAHHGPKSGAQPYRTGLPGRPTSWHLAEQECHRRWAAGERHPTVTAWAVSLSKWLTETHPEASPLSVQSLRNRLAPLLGELRAGARTRPE